METLFLFTKVLQWYATPPTRNERPIWGLNSALEVAAPSAHGGVCATPQGPAAHWQSLNYYKGIIIYSPNKQDMNRDMKQNLAGRKTVPEAEFEDPV